MTAQPTLYCSFCGKSQHEVAKLVAGPTAFICGDCVELAALIIREELGVVHGPRDMVAADIGIRESGWEIAA